MKMREKWSIMMSKLPLPVPFSSGCSLSARGGRGGRGARAREPGPRQVACRSRTRCPRRRERVRDAGPSERCAFFFLFFFAYRIGTSGCRPPWRRLRASTTWSLRSSSRTASVGTGVDRRTSWRACLKSKCGHKVAEANPMSGMARCQHQFKEKEREKRKKKEKVRAARHVVGSIAHGPPRETSNPSQEYPWWHRRP